MKDELNIKIRLSVQRALLGVITPNIRMITLGCEGLDLLHIIVYFDKEVGEMDKENISTLSAEILADIEFTNEKVECVYDTKVQSQLKVLNFIAFARKEN